MANVAYWPYNYGQCVHSMYDISSVYIEHEMVTRQIACTLSVYYEIESDDITLPKQSYVARNCVKMVKKKKTT